MDIDGLDTTLQEEIAEEEVLLPPEQAVLEVSADTSTTTAPISSDIKQTPQNAKDNSNTLIPEKYRNLLQRMYRSLLYSNECSGRKNITNPIYISYTLPNSTIIEQIQFYRGAIERVVPIVESSGRGSSSATFSSGTIGTSSGDIRSNTTLFASTPSVSTTTIALTSLQQACRIHDHEDMHILLASEIVDLRGLEEVLEDILRDVQGYLFTEHEEIAAQFHSLRYIPKGKKITNRVVQALDEDCIGWLVVTMPVAHSGGNMNISTYGHEINHLNESYLYSFGKLSYSAFLLDTEFSIDEVYTAGKIMLYYSLQGDKGLAERYRRPFAEPRPVVSSSAGNMSMNRERYENLQVPNLRELCTLRGLSSLGKKSELIERLDTGNHSANNTAVLMDDQHYQWPSMPKTIAMNKSRYFRSNIASLLTREDFLPDGGKLIFPLFHVYESEKELPAESNLIDNGFALHHDACESPMLKGADSLFLLALRNTRIPLQLLRLAMFIDGSMMLTNICKTLPDLKTALTKFTTWKLVNKTEYAAVINGSKLRDDMQPLDNNAQWAVDQSFTPIALLLEAYHSPSGCFDDCHGTCRVYSKVAAVVDIAPFNSVDRVHQINLLQLPLATQNLFDHIAPGAVPQIESFYAKNRFEFYSALQNTTAVHVSLEEAKAIAKKHEVNDKGSTKLIIEKVNRKLQNSKEY